MSRAPGVGPARADPAARPPGPGRLVEALVAASIIDRAPSDPPVVISDRGGRRVVRVGDVVVKAHAADTDGTALAARIELVTRPELSPVWLTPLGGPAVVDGRLVTAWPVAEPVDAGHDVEQAPWVVAAALLARLHRTPAPPGGVPPTGATAALGRAVARLDATTGAAAATVRRAFRALAAPPGPWRLVHGDWHLGQLVRRVAGWRLIDVDDLGLGAPAWDLARPAALFAAGLLDPVVWGRFLDAYRAHGGPAVPADGDPWPALDAAARSLVVRLAAQAVGRAAGARLDQADQALVDACRRMADGGSR